MIYRIIEKDADGANIYASRHNSMKIILTLETGITSISHCLGGGRNCKRANVDKLYQVAF